MNEARTLAPNQDLTKMSGSGRPTRSSATAAGEVRRHRHYPAIDGLRAVAILIVVLNHADVPGFGRGFIGVDMFFAISGFLITDRIVTEPRTGATQPLASFWAGRARRILPAMAALLVVTCLLSALTLGPQELGRVAGYGIATNFFTVNNLIAFVGGNYFAGPLRELPFLHMWSLALEEQFYLVWPLALGPVARFVARRTGRGYASVVGVGLALCIPVSLLTSILLTSGSERWAFYTLPTRVYEFALGGAAVLCWDRLVGSRLRTLPLEFIGAALIAIGMAATPIDVGFPSAWPLLAAGGTALVIVGSERHTVTTGAPWRPQQSMSTILASTPLRAIGRYSYGWYLWHWPLLVLGTIAWSQAWGRAASVVALVPAIASFHLIEQPVRYSRALSGSNRRSLTLGAALLAIGAIACAALAGYGRLQLRDPSAAGLAAADESFQIAGCTSTRLLGEDVCLGGSANPDDPLILLAGDSHAGQWMAAFSQAGHIGHFRVALRWLGNCSAFPFAESDPGQPPGCRDFQLATRRMYDSDLVSAIVVTEAIGSRDTHGSVSRWLAAAEEVADTSGRPLGIIVDNPLSNDPLRCFSRGGSVADCSLPRSEAVASIERYRAAEAELTQAHHVLQLDLTATMCPSDPCPLKFNGVWIAAKENHLTREFTLSQKESVGTFVEELVLEPKDQH